MMLVTKFAKIVLDFDVVYMSQSFSSQTVSTKYPIADRYLVGSDTFLSVGHVFFSILYRLLEVHERSDLS